MVEVIRFIEINLEGRIVKDPSGEIYQVKSIDESNTPIGLKLILESTDPNSSYCQISFKDFLKYEIIS